MGKIETALNQWCSGEGIRFESLEAKEKYQKRARRIADVILLKTPDRLPVELTFGMFPALDSGYTCEEVVFDFKKARKAWMKTILEFTPDMACGAARSVLPGNVLDLLGANGFRLPGRGIPATSSFQAVEKEWLTAEEFYDPFIKNPTELIQQTYMKRLLGVFKDIERFPSGLDFLSGSYGASRWATAFATPEFKKAVGVISRAGEEAMDWNRQAEQEREAILAKGFPGRGLPGGGAPFDTIGNYFRGTRGVMLDMFRCPEKLHEAMAIIMDIRIDRIINLNVTTVSPIVPIFLHKGAHSFMSVEQFEVFYWPYLHKIMLALIENGLVPMPVFEADYQSRLHIIKDIPDKSAIYCFEKVDMAEAKKILGDTVCLMGNVPNSLLCTGSPDDVKDNIRGLVDDAGIGGGLIIAPGSSLDNPKKENLRAFVDFAKQYGVCH